MSKSQNYISYNQRFALIRITGSSSIMDNAELACTITPCQGGIFLVGYHKGHKLETAGQK